MSAGFLGRRPGPVTVFLSGRPPCTTDETANRRQQQARFERLLQNPVGPNTIYFLFVDRLHGARRQDNGHTSMSLYILTELVPGHFRHRNISNDQVRSSVLKTQHRHLAVAYGDDFVALIPQDALSHALGMGAVIGQQDAAHCWGFAAGLLAGVLVPAGTAVFTPFFAAALAALAARAAAFFCCCSYSLICCLVAG